MQKNNSMTHCAYYNNKNTHTYVQLNSAVTIRDEFNGKPHASSFMVDRAHDFQT